MVAESENAGAEASLAGGAESVLKPGCLVEIFGLESETGKTMNGKRGIIAAHLEEKGRFEVELGPGKKTSLKPCNLRRVEVKSRWKDAGAVDENTGATQSENLAFKLGQRVEVFGLESDGGRALNGKKGLVTKYLAERDRFQVELGLPTLQSIRPQNLRAVDAAPASATGEPAARAPPAKLPFRPGHVVEIYGLDDAEDGARLNGEKGFVTGYDTGADRFCVSVGAESKSLRACNLKKVEFRLDPVAEPAGVPGEGLAAKDSQEPSTKRSRSQ